MPESYEFVNDLARGITRRQALLAGGSVFAAGFLAACTGSAGKPASTASGNPTLKPVEGGNLKIAFNADAEGVASPLHPPGTGQLLVVLGVYDTLFVTDRTQPGFIIKPRLATGYKLSSDAKQYTIPLRTDVKFHNGKRMTARDVAYTIEQNLTSHADMAGLLSPFLDKSGIKVVDDHTIQLNLKTPNPFLPQLLKEYRMGIFPEGTTDFTHPIGTGPFKFVNRKVNVGFDLGKNPDYFIAGQPHLDQLSGVVIPEVSNAVQALKQGSVDWVQTSLPASLVTQVAKDSSVNLVGLEADYVMPIMLNPKYKPFDDVRVRQAIKLCIDREQWKNVLWAGHATPVSDIPVAPGDPLGPDLTLRQQNIAKAKQLLADAGYPNGIDITIATTDDGPAQAQGPIVLAQQAAPAGIRIKVNKLPVSSYYDSKAFGGPAWANYINRRHVSTMVQTFILGGAASGEWNPASVQQRFNDALSTTDESKQAELFTSIFTDMSDQSGVLVPVLGDSVFAVSAKATGFDANSVSLCGYFGQIGLS